MITRSKIQKVKKVKDLVSKEKPHKQFKDHLFFGKENQTSTVYIASKPGSGKTALTLQMINRLCDKNNSQIFWISDITGLDKKVTEILEDYHVQYYSLQDVKNGCIRELFEFLKRDRMETDEYFPYIRWFFVFDDIILKNSYQEDLMIFIKTLRHFQAAMCVMIGQDFVHTIKKSARNIFGVQIIYRGVNLDRLKDVIYKQLTLPGLTYEDFIDIYKDATKEQYSCLIIDNRGQLPIFQKNFDHIYNLELEYNPEEEIKQVKDIKNPFL